MDTKGTDDLRRGFMRRAIELSMQNVQSGRGGPFGAVIVKDGHVVSEGTNLVTSAFDATAHAEIVAIRGACRKLGVFQLRDCEIYTSCEPCPMCLGAIYWAHLSHIFFANSASDASAIGFDDSMIYRELGQPLSDRAIPMIPLMRDEALLAFREWQKKPDKIAY